MGVAVLLHSLLLAAAVVKGAETLSPVGVPGAYIFELHDGEDASEFYAEANVHATTRLNLTYSLFKGVSLQFHNVDTAEGKVAGLAQLACIKAAYPVRAVGGPGPQRTLRTAPPSRDPVLAKRQEQSEDSHSTHVMTQVDKLRAKGVTGKGVKIGVIDSGIDYLHPDLGGCFGDGCLVGYGTDLVGDDYDGTFETFPKPDSDPMDCSGHGTSVASIIAARNNSLGFTGAAPDVTLGIYRVLGCTGTATNDVIIAAFNQAYEDGSNIITASIAGGPGGWIDEPWSAAVSRIVDAGVPCTVATGNSGQMGMFFGGSAGGGKGVTSVASFDNTVFPSIHFQDTYTVDGGSPVSFTYVPSFDRTAWDNVSLPLWSPSVGKFGPENGCDPYTAGTPDLSAKIVLVRRGDCDFSQKADNAASAGAKYLMIYNNDGAFSAPYITLDSAGPAIVAAGLATAEAGTAWMTALQAGSEVILQMTGPSKASRVLEVTPNNATGGYPSNLTSWGPNFDGFSKPSFGAPGGYVVSLLPVSQGSYEVNSGTSLSTPLVAAVMALVGQVRGTFDPTVLESLLSATAKPSRFNLGFGAQPYLAPVAQQGAGLIQAFDAAYATCLISVSSLSFNDTNNLAKQSFSIKNLNTEAVTYELSNIGAATAYTFSAGADASPYPMSFPNELVADYAELDLSESKVTIPGGGNVTIEVTAKPPALDTARVPVWSGYIALNGSDGSTSTLPYQGISGNLHNITVLVDSPDSVWMTTSDGWNDAIYDPVPGNHTFVLPPPGTANGTNTTIAAVAANLAFGSPLVRFWLVPLTPSIAQNATEVAGGITTIGQIAQSPMPWISRDVTSIVWDGQLNDGTFAPEGQYKFVVQALHVYGDESKIEEFDHAESPTFNIVYNKAS